MTDIEYLKEFADQQLEINKSMLKLAKNNRDSIKLITGWMEGIVDILSQETKQQEE